MTTLVELNKLVRDSINQSILISDVIVANPNAPRPKNDFATVYTAEMAPIGSRDVEYSSSQDDLDEKVLRMFEARISINFFRDNARLNAALFVSSLPSNSLLTMYNDAGVGITRHAPIRDLTQVFNSSHEERAQVDLFLNFELTAPVEKVTGVDFVRINGDIDNGNEVVDTIHVRNFLEFVEMSCEEKTRPKFLTFICG